GRRPARRVPRRRTALPEPAVPVRDLPGQGTGRRQCHPADRLRRLPVDVLLPDPLHAERARLFPRPERLRLPARHRRHRPRRLRVFSAIATAHTRHPLAGHAAPAQALTAGFGRALAAGGIALLAAACIALRATNTRGHTPRTEPAATPDIAGPPIPVPAE